MLLRDGALVAERDLAFRRIEVSADETLVAFSDDVRLTSSETSTIGQKGICVEMCETHLMIPYLTTARTTAFMPALSPPDVTTAILGFAFDMVGTNEIRKVGVRERDAPAKQTMRTRQLSPPLRVFTADLVAPPRP